MRQLVYISAETAPVSEALVADILEVARRNNAENDISGLLMYHDGQFFQLLEGPERNVLDCFRKISADPRHTGIITLFNEPSQERIFAGWDMAMVGMADFSKELRMQMIDLLQLEKHNQYDKLHTNKVISVFVRTYLSDINRLASEIKL